MKPIETDPFYRAFLDDDGAEPYADELPDEPDAAPRIRGLVLAIGISAAIWAAAFGAFLVVTG